MESSVENLHYQRMKFIGVVMAICLVLLLCSAFGVLRPPVAGARRFRAALSANALPGRTSEKSNVVNSLKTSAKDSKKTDKTREAMPAVTAAKPVVRTSSKQHLSASSALSVPPTAANAKAALPIGNNDPQKLEAKDGVLKKWPTKYALPELYLPDLSAARGKNLSDGKMNGITVILDPAKGGKNTGVSGKFDKTTLFEKDINLDVAVRAEKMLSQLGCRVILTRSDDRENSLFYVAALAAADALARYKTKALDAGYDAEVIDELLLHMQKDVMRINDNDPASGGRGIFGDIGTPPRLRLIYDAERQMTDTIFINISCAEKSGKKKQPGLAVNFMSQEFCDKCNNSLVNDGDFAAKAPNYSMFDSKGRSTLAHLLYEHALAQVPELKNAKNTAPVSEKDMAVLRLNAGLGVNFCLGDPGNKNDFAYLQKDEVRQRLATAIVGAVFQYFSAPNVDK